MRSCGGAQLIYFCYYLGAPLYLVLDDVKAARSDLSHDAKRRSEGTLERVKRVTGPVFWTN